MFASPTAMWLDSFFAGYDHFFLMILHGLEHVLGFALTPLMKLVTLLGEKGILFFLIALIFMLCADRRDLGVCIFGAVCCGALITNIILKDNVARLRPFEASSEYALWWFNVGSPAEDGFSFPSGHVTACAAGMTAITLMRGKKWLVPSIIVVLVMGISRNYLMAHYPSDVLFAAIIGVASGFIAWFITQLIFRFLRRNRRKPVFAAILNFDIRDVLPFELPALPLGGRDGKKAAPRARRSAAPERAPAPEPVEGDEDVKTYRGARAAEKAEAAAPARPAARGGSHVKRAPAAKPAPAEETKPEVPDMNAEEVLPPETESEAAPEAVPARRVRAAAPAARTGRHEIVSADSAAKPKSGLRMPKAGYQGKHVK